MKQGKSAKNFISRANLDQVTANRVMNFVDANAARMGNAFVFASGRNQRDNLRRQNRMLVTRLQ